MEEQELRKIIEYIDCAMPYVKESKPYYALRAAHYRIENAKKKYVTQKEFKPDYSKDCEVAAAVQLDLAVEVFVKMIDEMGISLQDFLGELMYTYGLEPEDVYVVEG